ncbi:hypothetical protein HanRHA438_Chr10g0469551 [Helianthus annuus]|uniref:DUF3511 domain protein n=1 Tax=Helianthus annuus TaxID=4232 RepID=A0A251TPI7_HELAN|nr:uncharacterized protein LOC110886281 [Helianthus annuus]KAF5787756.1 hypothetical protein HanXRQr2_Chr10g0456451 [Helianthus annuus]KAJ0514943.1 hypothetical protein HanHA300_Chr10g0375231 [Helianthus annuus]KAJ0523287.1 hypothetical protein HanIR_Chr10g0492141 [Helianthus annuus]KAJ0531112.1 hypothetical protein HanHA89_Chr10g0397511 [Helianthus annuus]KAJ0697956.1 hypothetical protein HanLR1_Chr10g0374841 [Helianthus annuus]
MANYRSESYNYTDRDMQLDTYNYPKITDFRSYSVNYASSYKPHQPNMDIVVANDFKLKKVKSTNGSASKSWRFSDPEFQRKKRVAGYKAYAVEGKLKGSFRKSFRWIKDKYLHVVYG